MNDASTGLLIGGGVCFLFFIIGIIVVIVGIRNRKKAEESSSWPSVQGLITKAWVDTQESEDEDGVSSVTHYPRWEYEYAVSGMTYTNQKITFGGTRGYSNRAKVEADLEQYPLNSRVIVFYDPSKPDDAVLVPGTKGTMAMIIFGIVLTLIMFIACIILAIKLLTG